MKPKKDKRPIILWVDDDPSAVKSFLESLREACKRTLRIEFRRTVDGAWEFFREHHRRIIGLILAPRMPSGELFSNLSRTERRKTGVLLYQKMLAFGPVPVLFFSKSSDKNGIYPAKIKELDLEKRKYRSVSQHQFPVPKAFSAVVSNYFGG